MIHIRPEIAQKFPEFVPVLREEDIIRDRLSSADGKCHCLEGWIRDVFGEDGRVQHLVRSALISRARKQKLDRSKKGLGGVIQLAYINDYRRNTLYSLTKLWNDTMRIDFGYKFVVDDDSPNRICNG